MADSSKHDQVIEEEMLGVMMWVVKICICIINIFKCIHEYMLM
jgi:hypothetical protein